MSFKKLVLVVLFVVVTFSMNACYKSPEVDKQSDVVEIMYERVLPIVCPQDKDPTGLEVFSYAYGGKTPPLKNVDENKWVAIVELRYSNTPYAISVIDAKVFKNGYVSTARKFYARISGQDQWIELTRIVPHSQGDGEQAEFILNVAGICTNF